MAVSGLKPSSVRTPKAARTTRAKKAHESKQAVARLQKDLMEVTARAQGASQVANAQKLAVDVNVRALEGRSLDAANTRLAELAPDTFRKVVAQLDQSGALEAMFEKASPDERAAFTALAVDMGLVRDLSRAPAAAPFAPPALRELESTRALPLALRREIHAENEAAKTQYAADYRAYVGRYLGGVQAARTMEALRDLGPHAEPQSGDRSASLAAAMAVSDKMYALLGQRAPGTVYAEAGAKVTASLEAGPVRVGGELKLGATADASGVQAKKAKVVGTLEGKDGKALKGSPEEAELGWGAGNKPGRGLEPGTEKWKLAVATDQKGNVEVKTQFAYSRYNPRTADVGMGVKVDKKLELGGLKVGAEAKLGVGMQLLPVRVVENFLDREHGFFTAPRALEQKQPWSALSPAERQKLESFGWTKEEWAARLAR